MDESDFDKAEWRIPAERMKMREMHIVPLSRQAVAVLRELQQLTGHWHQVFPNQHKPSGCMSENTVLFALYRMGYHSKATGHGFRSTASTILNEHDFSPDVIERQLAHSERNQVRAAYNHAQYLPERRKMMQWWADYLDGVAQTNSGYATLPHICSGVNHSTHLATIWQQDWQCHRMVVTISAVQESDVTHLVPTDSNVTAMCCQCHVMAGCLDSGPSGVNHPVQVQVLSSAILTTNWWPSITPELHLAYTTRGFALVE